MRAAVEDTCKESKPNNFYVHVAQIPTVRVASVKTKRAGVYCHLLIMNSLHWLTQPICHSSSKHTVRTVVLWSPADTQAPGSSSPHPTHGP